MSLLSELQLLFELPDPYAEAHKKLVGTWCVVNGKCVKIDNVDSSGVVFQDEAGKQHALAGNKVDSFNLWLPEAGLYPLKDKGYAWLIVKVPKRQWLRSYSGSYYKVSAVGLGTGQAPGPMFPSSILASLRSDFFVDKFNKIWFWNNPIGHIEKNGDVVCTDLNFKQEILDWERESRGRI